jgi:transcriptional regulator with XRE-family HTH domain
MNMNEAKPAEEHHSEFLNSLLQAITPEDQEKTDNRMLLASRIDDARQAKGWSKKQFAKEMKQLPSVISKWLSGTHNFTADTLFDIGKKLDIELVVLKDREVTVVEIVKVIKVRYQISVDSPPAEPFARPTFAWRDAYKKKTLTQLPTKEKYYA